MSVVSLIYDDKGSPSSPLSPYQPPQEVKDLLSISKQDLIQGDEILNRPFNEFNNHSLIERMNLDQKDWLAWSDPPSDDPDESFMFKGTSLVTRNKIISTAAHLTEQIIFPNIFAQNKDDEVDEAAAFVMREVMEYYARKSNYEQTFLYSVIAGLVNPVNYWEVNYAQAFHKVLTGTQSAYTRKKVVDEVLSGFQDHLIAPDELLIANPYVFDIQKQPFLIQRRRISYTEAKEMHGDNPNFTHVRVGVYSVLNTDGAFYDVEDGIQDNLVEELRFRYRTKDCEFVCVNGIYLSNDNTDYNPMRHRRITKDGTTVPMYPIVKYGAEPIDAKRFWAYKSLAAKLSNDKELVDRMRQNAVDASTFATYPSIFGIGTGKIDKSIFIPATVYPVDKDAKIQPATGLANPSYAYTAAQEAERAINETSQDPQLSGVSGRQKTARESILLQQNALTNLGIMGKMMGTMVKQVGELKIDDIVRYTTIGETEELGNAGLGMKYQTLVINDKVKEGGKKNIVIRFTDSFAGYTLSGGEKEKREARLFEEAGDGKEIYEVNPAVWSRMQFLVQVEPDALRPKNDAFERSLKLETYDRAIQNPLIASDPEKLAEVTRDFLFEPTVKGDAVKYIPKNPMMSPMQLIPGMENGRGIPGRVVENRALQDLTLA